MVTIHISNIYTQWLFVFILCLEVTTLLLVKHTPSRVFAYILLSLKRTCYLYYKKSVHFCSVFVSSLMLALLRCWPTFCLLYISHVSSFVIFLASLSPFFKIILSSFCHYCHHFLANFFIIVPKNSSKGYHRSS